MYYINLHLPILGLKCIGFGIFLVLYTFKLLLLEILIYGPAQTQQMIILQCAVTGSFNDKAYITQSYIYQDSIQIYFKKQSFTKLQIVYLLQNTSDMLLKI